MYSTSETKNGDRGTDVIKNDYDCIWEIVHKGEPISQLLLYNTYLHHGFHAKICANWPSSLA